MEMEILLLLRIEWLRAPVPMPVQATGAARSSGPAACALLRSGLVAPVPVLSVQWAVDGSPHPAGPQRRSVQPPAMLSVSNSLFSSTLSLSKTASEGLFLCGDKQAHASRGLFTRTLSNLPQSG